MDIENLETFKCNQLRYVFYKDQCFRQSGKIFEVILW